MPFIHTTVTTAISNEQETQLKERLGKAIECIPGKSEQWLMLAFDEQKHMYFRGDNSEPIAFVDVSVFGEENKAAFSQMTGSICDIFNEVLGISPDNIYVKYEATKNWGWNGANF